MRSLTHTTRCALGLAMAALLTIGSHADAQVLDLGISDDVSYQHFLDAVRATEYVRSDYATDFVDRDGDGLLDDISTPPDAIADAQMTMPRVVGVVAALLDFATRYPGADQCTLRAFAISMDDALATVQPGDPDLRRMSHFVQAMRFLPDLADEATPPGCASISLAGYTPGDPDALLGLLDIEIPEFEGAAELEPRMSAFQHVMRRSFANSPAFANLLTIGFMGRDLNGTEHPDLEAALRAYLQDQGYAPNASVGAVARFASIDAALADLPQTYADYQAQLAEAEANADGPDPLADSTLLGRIEDRIGEVFLQIDGHVDAIHDNSTYPIQNAIDNAQSVAAAEAMKRDLVASLKAVEGQRLSLSADTMLLLQSADPEIRDLGANVRDFSGVQLDTNGDMVKIEQSMDFAVKIGAGLTSAAMGNIGSLVGVGESLFGLIGLFSSPSFEEIMFEQIVETRQQVEDLRVEMHHRFDRIEQQINAIFVAMIDGIAAIQQGINHVAIDLELLSLDVARLADGLSRLEETLYIFAQDEFQVDLLGNANLFLNYRNGFGVDLPYTDPGGTSFRNASSRFLTFATSTARTSAFVGGGGLTLANADEMLSGSAVSRHLAGLGTLSGTLVGGAPLWAGIAAPGPWTQGAAAYSQLARENPWYFARLHQDDPSEVDQIIATGQDIANAMAAARSQPLFHELFDLYTAASSNLQTHLTSAKNAYITGAGLDPIDPWGSDSQQAAFSAAPTPTQMSISGVPDSALIVPSGKNIWNTLPYPATAALCATLLEHETAGTWGLRWNAYRRTDGTLELDIIYTGDNGAGHTLSQMRRIVFDLAYGNYFDGTWTSVNHLVDPKAAIQDQVWDILANGTYPVFPKPTIFAQETLDGRTYIKLGLGSGDIRVTVSNDTFDLFSEPNPSTERAGVDEYANFGLGNLQDDVWAHLIPKVEDDDDPIGAAAASLSDIEALIDAYTTLAFPDAMQRSTILNAGLRALPTPDGVGIRKQDVLELLFSFFGNGDDLVFKNVAAILNTRLANIQSEIDAALDAPPALPDYLGWTLREIKHRRDHAARLAADDRYQMNAGETLIVDAPNGLLANDTTQPFREVLVDGAFEFDAMHTPPQHGTVSIGPDGSFQYTPDPGFGGMDRFNYRTTTDVSAPAAYGRAANPAYSAPATVVISVIAPAQVCDGDMDGDNDTDVFDFNVFATGFGSSGNTPLTNGDLDGDGDVDVFDFNIFAPDFGCDAGP